jgi:hypothetical protein
MRNIIFIIFGIVIVFLGCRKEPGLPEKDLDRALREYGVERREEVFSRLEGADSFIRKFKLTSEEIELVGEWRIFPIGQSSQNGRGIGLSIGFLPNRVFIVYDNRPVQDKDGYFLYNNTYDKLGYWKVEKGRLLIRFLYLYTSTSKQDVGEYNSKEKMETEYYPIWEFGLHEKAAVQKKKFYYNRIPKKIKEAYKIDDGDFFRARHVIALSFDGFNTSLYGETKRWHAFLMNPDLDDEQYVYNLRVMATLGDVQERPYDFEKNKFGLDFSKWE